ncbi:MAG: hypothetical protein H7249_02575 [Chitinophagaceae bacterium]|nr:hypothetical protein [Oligoflexus sp.]
MRPKTIEYKTDREIAWRNLLVSAINAGIQAGVITEDETQEIDGKCVEFTLDGIGLGYATFDSINFGEVSIEVVVDPKDKTDRSFTKFPTGATAKAHGYVERETGFYLQPTATLFQSKKPVQQKLFNLKVEPNGFEDNGRKFL